MTTLAPILEFDPAPQAILEPHPVQLSEPAPRRALLCFFQEVLAGLAAQGELVEIGHVDSEIGANPIYRVTRDGQSALVLHPGVGAPLAAGFLEEIIALGVDTAIACGGCGVLQPEIAAGHPVVLQSAIRDEGVSYHYLPPARSVEAHPDLVAALTRACQQRGIEHRVSTAWTTDAIYRETVARRHARIADGCDVVEMEAAAFFAVAQFRGVRFGQVVYGGDLVIPEGWDSRRWNHRSDDRRLLFEIALAALLNA